ncbi:MAG: paraquat-inducible protein B [Candidatus Azotimanducaceae bacterium]
MSEHGRPEVKQKAGPSIIWLIPLVTAIVGGWLAVQTLIDQAPTATITFNTAEGIQAGKTSVKYKNVEIGLVDEIRFAEDFDHVELSVTFNEGMDQFLRRNTRFWVVRPQFSLRGVSGLGTLLSGSYIEIDPGPGSPQNHFVGLEEIPLITRDDAGTKITLVSNDLGSLAGGSPIYYQGLFAGEVLGYELGSDAESIYIHAFIRDPYDQLVRGNSRFWNVSGLDVSMGADGIEIKTASVQALMFGGISFETPTTLEPARSEVENLIFTLYPNHDVIDEEAYTRKLRFVMYFNSSVRGLSAGAPLEFKGIRIGSVLDVKLEYNPDDTSFRIPVLVEIEPDRIVDRRADVDTSAGNMLQTLVKQGLRARLSTGSLLTGQLYVELNMYPGTEEIYHGGDSAPHPELPTIPGAFAAMTESIQNFVSKLETVDVEEMGNDILGILDGTNELLNTAETEQTVTDLQASMRALKNILRNVESADLEQTIKSANNVLGNVNNTLTMIDGVLTPNSPLQYNIIQVTSELEETARALRSLVQMLERQPQAIIFGRGAEEGDGNEK